MEHSLEKSIINTSRRLVEQLIEGEMQITAMESCTGGYFASCITDVDGSSDVFKQGIVTYSNETKIKYGVSKETIETYGVYSKQVAEEMAKKARENVSNKEKTIGVGITGTLTRIHDKNEDSNMGNIYYSISNINGQTITKEMTIDAKIDRHSMKQYICLVILKDILDNI